MRTTCCAVLLVMGLAGASWAQVPGDAPGLGKDPLVTAPTNPPQPPNEPESVDPGLAREIVIGDRAPDFDLDGSQGQPVHLADLKGHWSMLVFSEDRAILAPLENIAGQLRDQGMSLYGVCPDAAPTLRGFAAREHLSFLLLADMSREVSQVYGMYDADEEVIRPGIVIVDPRGVVWLSLFGPSLQPSDVVQLAVLSAASL